MTDRFNLYVGDTEADRAGVADAILRASPPMPDAVAHRDWLLGLSVGKLQERLKTIQAQAGRWERGVVGRVPSRGGDAGSGDPAYSGVLQQLEALGA